MSLLANRLKKLREERGWSQGSVAKQLGMKCSSTYANWECGLRDPDTETLVKLAELYEVTTDYSSGVSELKSSSDENKVTLSEFDLELINEIKSLSNVDKEYVLGFIRKIKERSRE